MKFLKEAGYSGYSMSNNAVSAYADGEKPKSKWMKNDFIELTKEINPSKLELVSALPINVLRDVLLYKSSWHHTSSMYNRTDFYSFDEDALDDLTQEKVSRLLSAKKETPVENPIRKGDIDYITWEGTRNYPKAVKHTLRDVNIQVKGSFYIITDDNGKEILRKKIGSNGTYVTFK